MAAITSGVDLPMAVGLDFAAGTLGDAAERWITDGEFNPRKSITSGLAIAAGGRIYGNDPLKSAGSAFLRGLGSGAATSGINYISEFLGGMGQTGAGAYPGMPGMAGAFVSGALSPYTNGRDPRSGCDSSGLPGQGLGYSAARGYQYSTGQGESPQRRKRNFDFGDFFQGMLTEGVTEGLSNAGSFGLGKVFDAVKRGIQGRKNRSVGGSRGGKATQTIKNKFPKDNQAGRTFNFTVEDGKINIENGIQEADFVIDMDGNLHIGRGHSFLSGGRNVQAAGTMKVNAQGHIRNITNKSGHFQPTVSEAINYPEIFRNSGLNVDNSWIRVSVFDTSISNYVVNEQVFYQGPIQYMPNLKENSGI